MKSKPYVGITGPINVPETVDVCGAFEDAGYTLSSSHIPMLGFLVSYKTLNHQSTDNRRYPKIENLPVLLASTGGEVLTMMHYNSREMQTLAEQVSTLFSGIYSRGLCRALQLNVVWPDVEQVRRIKRTFPEMQIVFQASHKAMEGRTPRQIIDEVIKYGTSLDYLLIDPSGGRGTQFDLESSLTLYSELVERIPNLTVGFAGGFTGENVREIVQKLIERIGKDDFCIDAEGGLRDKITDRCGDDTLNPRKVGDYLTNASLVLK